LRDRRNFVPSFPDSVSLSFQWEARKREREREDLKLEMGKIGKKRMFL
jgi:hypothetical protein